MRPSIIKDNGGRRSGLDRRRHDIGSPVERRSEENRRQNTDRRSVRYTTRSEFKNSY